MKALTLWPEWAWAIHNLDKRVENRSWALPVGEWIALHAGKSIGGRPGAAAEDEGLDGLVDMARRAGWRHADWGGESDRAGDWAVRVYDSDGGGAWASGPHYGGKVPEPRQTIPTSAILGAFRVLSVDAPGRGDLGGWRVPDAFGNRLEYRPLARPIPCKGAQGLWTVPADVVAEMKRIGARGAA